MISGSEYGDGVIASFEQDEEGLVSTIGDGVFSGGI